MLHWVMICLGLPMMATAAFLNRSVLTDATDFQRYAFPFWLFLSGVILVFAGTWLREQLRSAPAKLTPVAVGPLLASSMPPVSSTNLATGLDQGANVQHLRAIDTGSLSALPPRSASGGVGSLTSAEQQARLLAFESDNERLRGFLRDAKASVSR
jgi:hypothetical protein